MGVSPYLSIPWTAPLHKGPGAECDRCPRTAAASPHPIRSSDVGRYRCATPEQIPSVMGMGTTYLRAEISGKKNRKQYGKAHIIVQWILEKPRPQSSGWNVMSCSIHLTVWFLDWLLCDECKTCFWFIKNTTKRHSWEFWNNPPTNGVAPPSQPPMILVHLPWPSRTPSE